MKRKLKTNQEWPPAHLALPSTIEAIERGRIEQRSLFPEQRSNSREALLQRLTAMVPGVTTGDRLPTPPVTGPV